MSTVKTNLTVVMPGDRVAQLILEMFIMAPVISVDGRYQSTALEHD